MWEKRSPRQIFEMLNTYKEMNADSNNSQSNNYTVKSKGVKIPEWLKGKIPEGAEIYHADDISQVHYGGV